MPNKSEAKSDDPSGIRRLSDQEKAKAIATALSNLSGAAFKIRVQAIDYRGYLGRRGPFKQPTRIAFDVYPADERASADQCIQALQSTSENDLAKGIAQSLGKMTGETYDAELTAKRILKKRPGEAIAHIGILIAKTKI